MNIKYTLLLVIPMLTACSSNPFSSDNFACKNAYGGGVRCVSAKGVYAMTNNSDNVSYSKSDISEINVEKDKSNNSSNAKSAEVETNTSSPTYILPEADKPVPVRTNAKVIRVKVFPYEDQNGDFHAGDYIFSEVEQRKWSLAESQTSKVQRVMTPLVNKEFPTIGNTSP